MPAAGLEHLKDAHWQLTESEARLRELLDGQIALIVRRDASGRISFANRAYCDAFAVTMDEVSGRRFKPDVLAFEMHLPAAGQRRRFAEQLETCCGVRWILWEEHHLASQLGARDTLCVGRDITDERRAAAELREARDAAELANRAKSRFLATMSHEIRTPMNGILGMASLLQDTTQTAEQQTYTRAIDQSAHALLALIDEILDFSKIEAGKLQLAAEVFSLRACVEDALRLIAPKAHEKAIALSCNTAGDVPDAMVGDPARVRQIILNLVSNAIKFTDEGRIDVTVRRQANAGPQKGSGIYEIAVKDTGVGIAPEAMPLLFVEFEQAEGAGDRRRSGTGLGLAISKRLARAMGGTIHAEGVPGKGATFTVQLRLNEVPEERALVAKLCQGAAPKAEARPEVRYGNGIAPRILIAEDNEINALLARRVSERAGCEVEVAGNGIAAIAAVENVIARGAAAFDLILMDIFMPDVDGIEATHRIKALYAARPMDKPACPPIIALTANAFAEDRDHCLASGMDDYLAKPFDRRQLTELLARWLPSTAPRAES